MAKSSLSTAMRSGCSQVDKALLRLIGSPMFNDHEFGTDLVEDAEFAQESATQFDHDLRYASWRRLEIRRPRTAWLGGAVVHVGLFPVNCRDGP